MGNGIRRHGNGWQAYVTVAGRFYSRSFPATTPTDVMQAWRAQQRLLRRRVVAAGRQAAGTLGSDIDRYLAAVAAMPTLDERARHLRLWVIALGGPHRLRETVTAPEIAAVLQGWLLTGLAPQTVRLRRTALAHLWSVLDGKGAPNPVRSVPAPPVPPPVPRALPVEVVRALLGQLRPGVTRARLEVLATTGLPAKQLQQLTRAQVEAALRTGVLAIQPRRKGHGAPGRTLPLTDDAKRALEAYSRLNAFGAFSGSSLWKAFRRAAVKVGVPDARPYDLRHTIGTEVMKVTGDLATVASVLGHAKLSTASRYAAAALAARDAAAMAKVPSLLPADLASPAPTAPTPKIRPFSARARSSGG